jgi:hypothetical protein
MGTVYSTTIVCHYLSFRAFLTVDHCIKLLKLYRIIMQIQLFLSVFLLRQIELLFPIANNACIFKQNPIGYKFGSAHE